MEEGLRIIELRAENVKRVVAVEIAPDPAQALVQITGRNGGGKTSVLDSILYALGGTKELPPNPIHDGAEKAEIVLDLGEYVVKRTITAKGAYLEVCNAAGAVYKSPQQLLDKLLGDLTFDPLAFVHMKPAEQRDILIRLTGQETKLRELALKHEAAFDQRRDLNRDAKRLQAALEEHGEQPAARPETLDTEALQKRQTEIAEQAHAIARAAGSVAVLRMKLQEAQEDVTRLQEELKAAEERVPVAQREMEAAEKVLEALPEADPTAATTLLEEARSNDAAAAKWDEAKRLRDQLTEAERHAADRGRTIKALNVARDDLLAQAQIGVEGVGLDDNGITFNGQPFVQASSAEQLRVSLGIAMAANPKVRVIRIMDGSLLDSTNLQVISDMAAARGYQVWIERVDESGTVGVVIEEGRVANAAPAAEQAA